MTVRTRGWETSPVLRTGDYGVLLPSFTPEIHPVQSVLETLAIIAASLPAWMDDALCPEVDPDLFYPADDEETESTVAAMASEAKKICKRCPVRAKCLEYSMETDEQWGIWGGVAERPRRHMRTARKRGQRAAA